MTALGSTRLEQLGLQPEQRQAFDAQAGPADVLGRVVLEQRGVLTLATAQGDREARIAGRLRHHADSSGELPVIGDWVIARESGASSPLRITATLPRKSRLSRKIAGETVQEQVVAANLDRVFIVMGLDGDYSPRRLERMLGAVTQGGAEPIVLLNKSDLCNELESREADIQALAGETPVLTLSALNRRGLKSVERFLRPMETIALLGSSGVGKSTLVNALCGDERMRTGAVRSSDDRGMHTTSHRELLQLEGGALLIDNPGIRELQLWDTEQGIDDAFGDIARFAERCRFRDCGHEDEPGCGVRAAVDTGELDRARLENFRAMNRELAHLARAQDQRAKLEQKRRWRNIHRAARKHRPRSFR